jgi:Lrp/AsnC family transcriptional regulator for asnA, asnC and gidA
MTMGNALEKTNKEIIRQLRDGRKSYDQIAKKLSITPNTVRARVKKLMKDGVLDITGVINPDKMENHFLAMIGVKLKKMNLLRKGEQFSKLKGVVSVSVVTGQFDLILIVLLNNEFGLLDFLTDEVSKVGEVLSTETFVVYKNFNLRVPYIL